MLLLLLPQVFLSLLSILVSNFASLVKIWSKTQVFWNLQYVQCDGKLEVHHASCLHYMYIYPLVHVLMYLNVYTHTHQHTCTHAHTHIRAMHTQLKACPHCTLNVHWMCIQCTLIASALQTRKTKLDQMCIDPIHFWRWIESGLEWNVRRCLFAFLFYLHVHVGNDANANS